MGVAGGPDLIQDGLVLDFDASDRNSYVSGSTTWIDLSGNNYSGSLVNGPTFSTGSGGNLIFDGTNDEVTIGSKNGASFVDTDNMTLSAFLKINNKNIVGVFGRFTPQASDKSILLLQVHLEKQIMVSL